MLSPPKLSNNSTNLFNNFTKSKHERYNINNLQCENTVPHHVEQLLTKISSNNDISLPNMQNNNFVYDIGKVRLEENGKISEITNLLNDLIKNNCTKLEEQNNFINDLKKINTTLSENKKIIISLEKNKLKIDILDNILENSFYKSPEQKNKKESLDNQQNLEMMPEVTNYDFNSNLWYISVSSVILAILIILLLYSKWKDIN
jgi:hypothetical protein